MRRVSHLSDQQIKEMARGVTVTFYMKQIHFKIKSILMKRKLFSENRVKVS